MTGVVSKRPFEGAIEGGLPPHDAKSAIACHDARIHHGFSRISIG